MAEPATATPDVTAAVSFAQLLERLEVASDRRCLRTVRQELSDACAKHPERFEAEVREVLRDSTRNPLGLLIHRVRDGSLESAPLPERTRAARHDVSGERSRLALHVDRGDVIVREVFSDYAAYEARAAELETELGAHNVERLAA
jgi:hypothetical protein